MATEDKERDLETWEGIQTQMDKMNMAWVGEKLGVTGAWRRKKR